MDKTFTAKDVRSLIGKYEASVKRQNKAKADLAATKANIIKTFDALFRRGVLSQPASDVLIKGKTERKRPPAVSQLISYVFSFRRQQPGIARLDQINAEYKNVIDHYIRELKPATAGMRWLFSSREKKESAANAFAGLSDIIEKFYYPETCRILDGLGSTAVPVTAAEADFDRDRAAYWQTICSLLPDAGTRGGRISEIAALCNEISEYLSIPDTAATILKNSRKKVEDETEKLLMANVVETLKGVPVEELNREHGGIRVKPLRDAGYGTMADIYSAGVFELTSVNGISRDGAQTCKNRAYEFAKKAKEGVRIRLSADDRNEGATRLVGALHNYRKVKDLQEKISGLDREYHASIKRDIDSLTRLGDGSGWYFRSDLEIEGLKRAWSNANAFLASRYPGQIGELFREISSNEKAGDAAWAAFAEDPISYNNTLESICPGALGNGDLMFGLPEDLAREVQDEAFFPDGLLCELRRYQVLGVKYILHQGRVLLGDEMGLGKTIQAIAAMVSLKNTGATHFLVVCPASVIENWYREIRKHSRLRAVQIHGPGRDGAFSSWIRSGGVGITTYETTGFLKPEKDLKIDLLVADEAHYVKNPEAQRTKNVVFLSEHAERMLFMTGTALENRVSEMISLIKILNPQIAERLSGIAFMSSAPQFRDAVAPIYYRRKREDVLTELPDLIEKQEWCRIGAAEMIAYERAVLSRDYNESRRVSWNISDMTRSSKANRMLELIDEAAGDGRKIIVFSFYLDTMRKVCALLGPRCYGPINGSVPPARRQEIIDEFNNAPAGSVLAAQIQAGGTGLNIQSASVVIICEPQLKPSIENQAISRAYRMGQARNVLVFRLLCDNTIDDRITELLEEKQKVFDAFADRSVAAEESVELDEKTLGDLIQAEIDRINEKNANAEVADGAVALDDEAVQLR